MSSSSTSSPKGRKAATTKERDRGKKSPHNPAPASADADGAKGSGERIAKRIARAGLCSRRDAERWIADGRVKLNGKVLDTPAVVVGPTDKIEVDGDLLPSNERTRLWLYHKPSGLVTTNRDPEGRPTLFEKLPPELPRVISVGRLDINTEGLLLLTNDGGLARQLELPTTGWLRRYRVRAHGTVTQEQLDALQDGVAVDGILYGSIDAQLERVQGTNVWLTFAMREGKNREVKAVLASLGLDVNRLIRLSYGPFQLGDLASGTVREVRGRTLRDQLGAKLIEAAGANFDAPVATSTKVAKDKPKAAKPARKPHEKGAAKRKANADPLARLDTRKPQRGASAKKGGGKSKDTQRKKNYRPATGSKRSGSKDANRRG